ncbi:hypothetical protein [Flavobacterium sp. 5]|uniref:hypothetical protein n=1 Tax=Flavobacterium sp. 5 TaxID=2035199 RepID=UPI000C2B682F|nr:hypothetical protein [Flavobacterium sp. 5]PKB17561.1 hypothetical protein CLU82_2773 [Flavobacterium sp. 5]
MTQKKFDRLLLILSILCFLTILQIKFFHIKFNYLNFDIDTIDKTNDIVFNLATNIIASYIFYVINIQIVTYIREKKTRKLINNYLTDLATQMKVGQLYLNKTYFNNVDFETLTLGDFSNLTTLQNTQINFRYQQINTLGINTNYSTGTYSEIDLFDEEREMVKNNIQIIFSFPYISSVDYDLINLLHKIQSSFFYIGVKHIKGGVIYLNFNQHFFEHYENFKALKKFVEPRQTT